MGKKQIVNRGDRYFRLTIVKEIERYVPPCGRPMRQFECDCDCGKTTKVLLQSLRNSYTKSCGCYNSDKEMRLQKASITNLKHNESQLGKTYTVEYNTWKSMKYRCYNPNGKSYKDYGGRGITVCDRWINSYENFLADMGRRPEGMSIDRIDNDGNYSPDNCRWADKQTQIKNRRKQHSLDVGYSHSKSKQRSY